MGAAHLRRWAAAATASALLLFASLGCAPTTTPQAAATCVPELLTPAPDAVVDNGRTDAYEAIVDDFAWTACPGAVMYELQRGRTDPTSALPALRVAGTSYRRVELGSYVADHNLSGWRWRVRALVGDVWQPWSEERAYTVEPPNTDPPRLELVTPRLLEPAADALLEGPVTYPADGTTWGFRWSHVPIANAYRLVVNAPNRSAPFAEAVIETGGGDWRCDAAEGACLGLVAAGTAPFPADAGTGWTWRVQPRIRTTWGPWSATGAFRVEITPPVTVAPGRIEGRLPGWTLGEARIVAIAKPEWPPVAEGAVAADGSFAIDMPALVLPRGLAAGGRLDAGVELSGSFRYLYVVGFVLIQDGVEVGTALLGTSPAVADLWWAPRGAARGEAAALWWYADRAASMHGERDVYRLDLDLPGGWSRVLLRVASGRDDPTPFEVQLTVVDDFPADLAWHWTRSGAP